MLDKIQLIAKEIEQIILQGATDKSTAKNRIQRLKTLMPEYSLSYIPSGKTHFVSILLMAIGALFGTIIYVVFNCCWLYIANFILDMTVFRMLFLNLYQLFFILVFLGAIGYRFLYPYQPIVKLIVKFIAYLSKNSNNRNKIAFFIITSIPPGLLFLWSIIFQFRFFERLSIYEDLILRTVLLFITFCSCQAILTTIKFAQKDLVKQKFSEQKKRYYQLQESRKYVANLAPYLKYLVMNKAYQDRELKEIINTAFEGYKSFVVVNVYKFPSNESYESGYIDMELTFKFKQNLGTLKESWYFYSEQLSKKEIEELTNYLGIGY